MRLAIYQGNLAGLPPDLRIDRLAEVAGQTDADLLLCPELFLSGYDIGNALHQFAEPANGPSATRIAEIARHSKTAIAYGYPEAAGGAIYNAAQCVDTSGARIANHRKTALPPGFEPGVFTPGTGLTLFTLHGITLALLICYEVEFPEAVRACAAAGAQLVLVPTALGKSWPVVAQRVVPARAFENGVFVAYANHAGQEGGTDFLGESCIIAPDGTDLARADTGDAVIAAEIDPARVTAMQRRLPYLRGRAELSDRLSRP